MRLVLIALALVAAAVPLPAATAPTGLDPLRLALRKSDFPAGATGTSIRAPEEVIARLRSLGVRGQAAYFAFLYKQAAGRRVALSGLVLVVDTRGQARTAFKRFKQDLQSDSGESLRLPGYGQEHYAVSGRSDADVLDLAVRQNRVVWSIAVRGDGVPSVTRAQALAELKKYARKQQVRVGAGR